MPDRGVGRGAPFQPGDPHAMHAKATAAPKETDSASRLARAVAIAGLLIWALGSSGCEEARKAMAELEGAAIVAPAKPAAAPQNVIPTADPIEVLTVVIEDERSLARVATGLGATIDDIMVDNGLDDSRVAAGTTLKVRTTQSRLARYLQARERRQARRAKREAARKAKRKKKPGKPAKGARASAR